MKNTIITGVIVDVFYDHFLAKNWTHYSTGKKTLLPDFMILYKTITAYLRKKKECCPT
jgi:acyl carrier protein phosphodiesterase